MVKGFEGPEGPHEKRFDIIDVMNQNCSKYRDINQTPPFSKGLTRDYL